MTIQKIEIFTGNCQLCDDTVQMVQELSGNICIVEVYTIKKNPNRFHQYGVKAVPSIAIDGTLVLTGKPSRSQLKAFGLDQNNQNLCNLTYLGMGI